VLYSIVITGKNHEDIAYLRAARARGAEGGVTAADLDDRPGGQVDAAAVQRRVASDFVGLLKKLKMSNGW
jgi:hypothetical protein